MNQTEQYQLEVGSNRGIIELDQVHNRIHHDDKSFGNIIIRISVHIEKLPGHHHSIGHGQLKKYIEEKV